MKWIKINEKGNKKLPRTSLYKNKFPYLVAYNNKTKVFAYRYDGKWLEWGSQEELTKEPKYWLEIPLLPVSIVKIENNLKN